MLTGSVPFGHTRHGHNGASLGHSKRRDPYTLEQRMRRREFMALVGGAAVAWPFGLRAQQPQKWRVGQVLGGTPETVGHLAEALAQRLEELGYVQGKNIAIVNLFVPAEPAAEEIAIRSLL